MWVPPFGHPWIYAYLQLPAAFRSLSRPSSAYSAWASALRPFSLDLCLLILRLSNFITQPVFSDCSERFRSLFLTPALLNLVQYYR